MRIIKERDSLGRMVSIHGLSKHPLFSIWSQMKSRCYRVKDESYYRYGGRGIKVCEEWVLTNGQGFLNFYNWAVANGWEEGLSIERSDVDGNYCPENCSWIPLPDQNKNRSDTYPVTYKGKSYPCLLDMTKDNNLNYSNVKRGYLNGLSIEDAVERSFKVKDRWKICTAFGETDHLYTLIKKYGRVSVGLITKRLNNGFSVEDALTIPSKATPRTIYTYRGVTGSIQHIINVLNLDIDEGCVRRNIALGRDLDRAFEKQNISIFEAFGVSGSIPKLVKMFSTGLVSLNTVRERLAKGWDLETALTKPSTQSKLK